MMIFVRVQGGFLAVSIVSAFGEGTAYSDVKREKMAWALRRFSFGIVASCSATPSLEAVNSRSVMGTSIIRLFLIPVLSFLVVKAIFSFKIKAIQKEIIIIR